MKFFSLENPVWKFIGNLADFFILSCLWYLCSLPVVTAGAAASAVYYVTLKMSRDQEGELVRSFFKSFRQNLKPGCLLGVGYLAAVVLLGWTSSFVCSKARYWRGPCSLPVRYCWPVRRCLPQ